MRAVLVWTIGVFVGVAALWGVAHVLISPVNPAQQPPSGHFQGPCWACHFVTSSAEVTSP